MTLLILFGVLLVAVAVGLPILLAIGLVGFSGMIAAPGVNPALFAQRIFSILDSFSLLALPYFILAGSIMSKGGLARGLVNFAQSLVGHVRGSLGHTAVISCMGMANVSGSSTAEAAAVGSIIIPSMRDNGYRSGLAASIVGTAATIGPIIPPSMTMIVYGAMTGVSIGGLFIAGIIPGIILGLMMMGTIRLLAMLPRYPELQARGPRASLRQIARATGGAWVALLAPVIILGGIFTGVFTATEAGIVACFYALIVSLVVYREIGIKDLYRILLDAAVTTGTVAGIIGMAGALGWLLSYLDFNVFVLSNLRAFTTDALLALILLLAVYILLTMFLESLAVLIVFVPIAAEIGRAFGYDPLHLGIILVVAAQLGATTPPVAVLLFVTTSIAGGRFIDTVRECVPFVLTLLFFLILLIVFPPLTTWLPGQLGR
ncbi:TRAP transporter large permease [Pararhodobacter sp. SW119]|uniref:TRAP transporter large permease n=1 Tax=Pararhodobacter sp. SW119 TaxID=2780075 RepID=UPI001ADFBA9B